MATRNSVLSGPNLALLAATMILGFLLTVQFRSTAAQIPAREQSRLAGDDTTQLLEEEQQQLKERIAALRSQITARQRMLQAAAEPLDELGAELDRQRLLAGLVPLRGPAVTVTLDDSTRSIGAGDNANDYLIHDYELRDTVSLLWLAGAEAIAINGERLVSLSSLYCVGSTILVNDTRLSPPYQISAIGNANSLMEALENPRNLAKLRSRAKTYGVQLKVTQNKDLTVPAYSGNLTIRYALPPVVPAQPKPLPLQQE